MKKARLSQTTVSAASSSRCANTWAILRKLGDGAFVVFDALFDVELGPPGLVVSFLAVLELVKEKAGRSDPERGPLRRST